MGLFDRFFGNTKTQANQTEMLAPPIRNTGTSYLTWSGVGGLYSLLSQKLPSSNRDWRSIAGDLGLNGVVACGLNWYIRNWNQVSPTYKRPVNGVEQDTVDGTVMKLLMNPCPSVSLPSVFYSNLITDIIIQGNGYIRKVRNRDKTVGALQYLPADCVGFNSNSRGVLIGYKYSPLGSDSYDIDVNDIIHIKIGRDPKDLRYGRSALVSALKEIATDNVAGSTAYALANSPLPSMFVSPDMTGNATEVTREQAVAVKDRLQSQYNSDNGAGVVVMTSPVKIEKVSHTPSDMALDTLRMLPETRICAVLGLNPMVLGLSSGLQHSTYSNYQEAQQQAWEDGMLPLCQLIAEAFTFGLLPEFTDYQDGDYIEYDYSKVKALMDNRSEEATRAEKLYKAGIASLAEAKRIAGLVPEDGDEAITTGRTEGFKLVADTAGTLIRAGYDVSSINNTLGIDIQHTGLLPVTVQETKSE
ncbi:COG4695 Phage-related protein [uncultured Caudovirales phage]|uniref:COG4695 Phage-related protein n=1 Tax=uncultured Caudovirales phage TaxID=2100421 RepID=A0A6J7WIH4_9CAUD|nr:COG4695 Phage-related protein [uncultured Caudovirales phage]